LKLEPKLVWSLYMRGLSKIALGKVDDGKQDEKAAQAIDANITERVSRYGIGR
jgi:hypothetical protein